MMSTKIIHIIDPAHEATFLEYVETLSLHSRTLSKKFDQLKFLRERPDYHPEESTFQHIKIVFCRLLSKGASKDLLLTALFHDITKFDEMKINPKNGYPTSPGHDRSGAIVAMQFKYLIEERFESNAEKVSWICSQHMRIQQIDQMGKKKQDEFRSHEWFEDLVFFNKADKMLNPEWNDFREVENPVIDLAGVTETKIKIMKHLSHELKKDTENYQRFWQLLFNTEIIKFNENINSDHPIINDDYNISDFALLKRLKHLPE